MRSQPPGDRNDHLLDPIDAQLKHYEYLNDAMSGDLARGSWLMLMALRTWIAGEPTAARRHLTEARRLFEERPYGAGLAKVQMYEWLFDDESRPSREALRRLGERVHVIRKLRRVRGALTAGQ